MKINIEYLDNLLKKYTKSVSKNTVSKNKEQLKVINNEYLDNLKKKYTKPVSKNKEQLKAIKSRRLKRFLKKSSLEYFEKEMEPTFKFTKDYKKIRQNNENIYKFINALKYRITSNKNSDLSKYRLKRIVNKFIRSVDIKSYKFIKFFKKNTELHEKKDLKIFIKRIKNSNRLKINSLLYDTVRYNKIYNFKDFNIKKEFFKDRLNFFNEGDIEAVYYYKSSMKFNQYNRTKRCYWENNYTKIRKMPNEFYMFKKDLNMKFAKKIEFLFNNKYVRKHKLFKKFHGIYSRQYILDKNLMKFNETIENFLYNGKLEIDMCNKKFFSDVFKEERHNSDLNKKFKDLNYMLGSRLYYDQYYYLSRFDSIFDEKFYKFRGHVFSRGRWIRLGPECNYLMLRRYHRYFENTVLYPRFLKKNNNKRKRKIFFSKENFKYYKKSPKPEKFYFFKKIKSTISSISEILKKKFNSFYSNKEKEKENQKNHFKSEKILKKNEKLNIFDQLAWNYSKKDFSITNELKQEFDSSVKTDYNEFQIKFKNIFNFLYDTVNSFFNFLINFIDVVYNFIYNMFCFFFYVIIDSLLSFKKLLYNFSIKNLQYLIDIRRFFIKLLKKNTEENTLKFILNFIIKICDTGINFIIDTYIFFSHYIFEFICFFNGLFFYFKDNFNIKYIYFLKEKLLVLKYKLINEINKLKEFYIDMQGKIENFYNFYHDVYIGMWETIYEFKYNILRNFFSKWYNFTFKFDYCKFAFDEVFFNLDKFYMDFFFFFKDFIITYNYIFFFIIFFFYIPILITNFTYIYYSNYYGTIFLKNHYEEKENLIIKFNKIINFINLNKDKKDIDIELYLQEMKKNLINEYTDKILLKIIDNFFLFISFNLYNNNLKNLLKVYEDFKNQEKKFYYNFIKKFYKKQIYHNNYYIFVKYFFLLYYTLDIVDFKYKIKNQFKFKK